MHRFILLFCLWGRLLYAQTEITYEFSGGRFGDNLLAYLHAKWLSYKYEIPLLYRPFFYSSDLVLHERELLYDEKAAKQKIQICLSDQCPEPSRIDNCIFFCPYFSEVPWEFIQNQWFSFKVDWKDPEFKKMAREFIAPKKPCVLTFPPPGVISVALHIREGGSFDDRMLRFKAPLKVPPLSFYVNSLKEIVKLFGQRPIYCYCFTDALDPEKLVNRIRRSLPWDTPIILDYRAENNHDGKNVIEDFFSLFNFDVLVRPASNYSIVPSLIGDYAVVIYPEEFQSEGRMVKITQLAIERNEELFNACLEKRGIK